MPLPDVITPDQQIRIQALDHLLSLLDFCENAVSDVDTFVAEGDKIYSYIRDGQVALLDLTPTAGQSDSVLDVETTP